MPETAQSQAWNGAERLRKVIKDGHILAAAAITVTASLKATNWVTSCHIASAGIAELSKLADLDPGRAKPAGHHQTSAYSDD